MVRQYMEVRLTVIGSSPAWPNPGSAQSGYLVEGEGALLLDCGPGVLARLRERGGTLLTDHRVTSIVAQSRAATPPRSGEPEFILETPHGRHTARRLILATGGFAVYHWRLLRWSPAVKRWRPYLAARPAFTGDTRTVHWRPQIVANPGWYRVELRVRPGGTALSKGFRVTC